MAVATAYQPPKYLPQPSDNWYHVLYGHVPGYQLDCIYRPQLPFQKLKLQHFSDLQLVIRHLRPPPQYPLGFAICNLSAHDTQHRPGHGALAIAAAVRIQKGSDHAGRISPVFTHAAVLVDQSVVAERLSLAACQFVQLFRRLGPKWYQAYYDENRPLDTLSHSKYIQSYQALPTIAADPAQVRWKARGATLPYARLTISCPDHTPLDAIVGAAARIATILYHSKVHWLSVGNGDTAADEQLSGDDTAPELTVRFEHGTDPSSSDPQAQCMRLGDLPADEQDLAAFLGLGPVVRSVAPARAGELPTQEFQSLARPTGELRPAEPLRREEPVLTPVREAASPDSGAFAKEGSADASQIMGDSPKYPREAQPAPALRDEASGEPPIEEASPQKSRAKIFALAFGALAVTLGFAVIQVCQRPQPWSPTPVVPTRIVSAGPPVAGGGDSRKTTAAAGNHRLQTPVLKKTPSVSPEDRAAKAPAASTPRAKQQATPSAPPPVEQQQETNNREAKPLTIAKLPTKQSFDAKSGSKLEPKPQAKPEPKAIAKLEPKAGAKPEPKFQAKLEPKSQAKLEPKFQAKLEPKSQARPEPKSQARPEPKSQAKLEPKSQAKPEPPPPKPEPKQAQKSKEQGTTLAKGSEKDSGPEDPNSSTTVIASKASHSEVSADKAHQRDAQDGEAGRSKETSPDSKQAMLRAHGVLSRCDKYCQDDDECSSAVDSARNNIKDYPSKNSDVAQNTFDELKSLCKVCAKVIPDICERRSL